MITHVKHVGIYVGDQQKALDFFTDKLGFEVLTDQSFGEMRWIKIAPPGAQTHLTLFTPPGLEGRVGKPSGVVFACEDVRATYAELRERGVTFTQEPQDESWGTWSQFVDTDGNTYVLASSGN